MPSAAPAADRALQEKPVIDVARPEAAQKIDSTLLKIVAASGMSPLKVMRDFLGLAFGPGRVSFADYEALRLFDSAFWAGADRRLVVGHQRNVAINQTINFRHDWWGMLDNKIATGSYLAAYGLPILPTVAVYCDRLKTGAGKVACDAEALRAVLTDESNYPMFGKPAEGLQSLGSIGLRRYLPQQQSLETREGRLVLLAEFIEQVRTHYAGGYLLQKFVSPHAAIRALCGDRLATVRMVTLTDEAGPRLFRACWKIPAGDNTADNFWRKGNLLAQVDLAQGTVKRALSGSGLELTQLAHHPDSGAPLIGFQIPHWQALVDTVIEAARLMQHIPLIGWDVAALDGGPVIVELNERPDFFLPQLADARGVLDPELTGFLATQKRKQAAYQKGRPASKRAA
jgi:Sugar-transfer associated ATP-grasp